MTTLSKTEIFWIIDAIEEAIRSNEKVASVSTTPLGALCSVRADGLKNVRKKLRTVLVRDSRRIAID